MLGLSIKKQGCENYLFENYHLKSWMKVTTSKINLSESNMQYSDCNRSGLGASCHLKDQQKATFVKVETMFSNGNCV